MERDGMSKEEAERMFAEAKDEFYMRLGDGDMPYDICEEWFGLEPDYIEEFI